MLGFPDRAVEHVALELLKELRAHSFQLDSTIFSVQK